MTSPTGTPAPPPAGAGRSPRSTRARRDGFTLIELILVVLIAMLAAGMAVPTFMRSYQGAQLRTSVRTVTMCHRYARNMAVLQQKDIAVLYDLVKNQIEIVTLTDDAEMSDRAMFLEERSQRTGSAYLDESEGGSAEDTEQPTAPVVTAELMRQLGEQVRVVEFDTEREDQVYDDIYWINYFSNGMCDRYSVRLADRQDHQVVVEIDAISGTVKVEYDD